MLYGKYTDFLFWLITSLKIGIKKNMQSSLHITQVFYVAFWLLVDI